MSDEPKVTEVTYIDAPGLPGPPNEPPTHTWPAQDYVRGPAGDPEAVPQQLKETGPRRTIDVEATEQ